MCRQGNGDVAVLFSLLEDQAKVRVCFRRDVVEDGHNYGRVIEGSILSMIGLRFLVHPRTRGLVDCVTDLRPEDVEHIAILESREDVLAGRHVRARGDAILTEPPRTRSGYRYALYSLALAAAVADSGLRSSQIEQQFDDLADEIALAKSKRRWLLRDAKAWVREGRGVDVSDFSDLVERQKFDIPLMLDFDPDPAVRKNRKAREAERMADPVMAALFTQLRRLRSVGLDARRPALARYLLIRIPVGTGKPALFSWSTLDAGKGPVLSPDMVNSNAARVRVQRAMQSDQYALAQSIVSEFQAQVSTVPKDPTLLSDADLLGLIQRHPDINYVERLRVERRRRMEQAG